MYAFKFIASAANTRKCTFNRIFPLTMISLHSSYTAQYSYHIILILLPSIFRSTQRCDTIEKNVTATAKENTLQYNATISNHEMEKKSFQEIISTLTSNALKKSESSSKEINMLMVSLVFFLDKIICMLCVCLHLSLITTSMIYCTSKNFTTIPLILCN